VLLNLVINARDAMNGVGAIVVSTGLDDAGRVAIEVADTGCGIPEEHLPKIFEPFFSTKGVQGNGLGLAAVRSIVEEHGGAIRVDSEAGRGAIFTIFLPAASESDARSSNAAGPPSSTSRSATLPRGPGEDGLR
jgi:signal transduction histidine kinase